MHLRFRSQSKAVVDSSVDVNRFAIQVNSPPAICQVPTPPNASLLNIEVLGRAWHEILGISPRLQGISLEIFGNSPCYLRVDLDFLSQVASGDKVLSRIPVVNTFQRIVRAIVVLDRIPHIVEEFDILLFESRELKPVVLIVD